MLLDFLRRIAILVRYNLFLEIEGQFRYLRLRLSQLRGQSLDLLAFQFQLLSQDVYALGINGYIHLCFIYFNDR